MKLRANIISVLISLLTGAIVGYFKGPVFVLAIWALIGLALGAYSVGRKASILNGAAFGFAVSYVFMVSGYTGADPLSTKLAPFLLFGVFGSICGLLLGLLGNAILHRH